ncbi:MAG: ATP-binding cassette domain-containing protein [Steroidobacteraceae bacterium]
MVLLVIVTAILTAVGPIALKAIVDAFSAARSAPIKLPVALIAAYVISQWLARTSGEIRSFIFARAERRIFRALGERLFAHLMRLPLRFHLDRQTGAISQTLDNGLQGYQLILHHIVFTCLPVGAQLCTIVLVLARQHQPMFLVIFCAAFVCYVIAFGCSAIATSRAAERASNSLVQANATMTDTLLNYESVKYFTAESLVQERVNRALYNTETEWVAFYRRYAVNGLVIATIFAGFLGLAVVTAASQAIEGRITVGDFVLINAYMLQVMQPVELLGFAVQGISQGMAMLDKMMSLLREHTEPGSPGADAQVGAVKISRTLIAEPTRSSPALQFENITLCYRGEGRVLDEISFSVAAGQTLGIVGPSGAGKSTIVRLLVRLFDPDSGRILLDGVPICDLPLEVLRKSIAVVPQDTILFNETIAYNIAFGKAGSSQLDIVRAAKLANLHEFIVRLPQGYDTVVGERGVKLSGGEKQRVTIARAALKRPKVFVFDEATSSLDSETEAAILHSLRHIGGSGTTLMIAHRLSTVIHADEIILLEGGRIRERGAHTELLRQRGRYAALWEFQRCAADIGQ